MNEGQGWLVIGLLMLIAILQIVTLVELDSVETVLRLMDVAV